MTSSFFVIFSKRSLCAQKQLKQSYFFRKPKSIEGAFRIVIVNVPDV